MNKEPIGLYIFRFLTSLGLFAFMAMLYWSSALIEQDLKSIGSDISQLRNDLLSLRSTVNKVSEEISTIFFNQHQIPFKDRQENSQLSQPQKSDINSNLSNLLTEDPFYKITLPQMLGSDFKPHGIRREASLGRPDNLHPFSNWSQVSSWTSSCTVAIATDQFGKYETFAPDMALKMELRYDKEGQPEYWLHLRQDVFWHPLQSEHFVTGIALAPHFLRKHQVTAYDFKFYFDAIMNPYIDLRQAVALRNYYSDVREIQVIDDFTLVVRWKTEEMRDVSGKMIPQMKYSAKIWTTALRPLARFVYQYFADGTKIIPDDSNLDVYRTNSIWAQNFSQHWAQNMIVSCGPWLFDGMTDREIRFRRNPDYYQPYAVLVNALEIKFRDSPDAIWQEFKSGTIDLFNVPPNQLAEFERFLQSKPYLEQAQAGLEIKRLDFVDRSYTYIGWNEARFFFKSKKIRQALTMAIDRKRIIQQNLNGMGIEITGPFFRFSPSYDANIVPFPFDLQRARLLLEEEGWYDSNGSGIIGKLIDGKHIPFRFTLTYYVKSPITKAICDYIATSLKEIGIICHLNGVDIADLSAVFDDKSFDAICMAWALGSPPEDPKQLWYSTGAQEKGSSNTIGFANAEIDAIIDQLQYEYDPQKRIELYHRFDAILHEEAPYTFIYTPKVALVYRDYLQNVFIPAERQDLIPGANVAEPQPNIFWINPNRNL